MNNKIKNFSNQPWRPTIAQLQAAKNTTLPDVIQKNLAVLFAGINPSIYSAAVGHHFARPGNRFWPALYAGGFTPRLYSPFDDHLLTHLGIGITNIAPRATVRADELTAAELRTGMAALSTKLKRFQPRAIAFLGITAFRIATGCRHAVFGEQAERIAGVGVFVLPNPSGLNAHFTPAALATIFRHFRTLLPWRD